MIIAVDPGGTTGIAVRTVGEAINLFQLTSPGEVYRFIDMETKAYSGMHNGETGTIVCENFQTAGRISRDGLATVRIIGGIQAIGLINGWVVYTPTPEQRYMMRTDAEQMAPKGYALRHQRDALMHLLAFEYRRAHGYYT